MIYLLGPNYQRLDYGSYVQLFGNQDAQTNLEINLQIIDVDIDSNLDRYQRMYESNKDKLLKSCHDISDGGALIAILESCFGGAVGASIELSAQLDLTVQAFSEGNGRFIVSIDPSNKQRFEKIFHDTTFLGLVTKEKDFTLKHQEDTHVWQIQQLEKSWKGSFHD